METNLMWLCCMCVCPAHFWTHGYATTFGKEVQFNKCIKAPRSFVEMGSPVGKTDES